MKKYQKNLKYKDDFQNKIAKLCNQFTEKTGLVITSAEMFVDVTSKDLSDLSLKIMPNYTVHLKCEV